ncbi:MAG: ABC transporter substrate-binding protein [Micromonosporaceae bacterium]
MRRRGYAAVSLLCALSMAASGCAAEEKTTTAGEIPIGVNIELSGPAAQLGESYKNGLEAVIDEVNKKGVLNGKKIKLIYRDNKTDPTEAIRVAKNFWDNQDVAAMIGPGVSPTSVPVTLEANKRKVPMISMASSTDVVRPASERKYSYKTTPNNDDMAEVQVEALVDQKIERVAYIAANNAYGKVSQKAFEAAAEKAGIEIVANELYNEKDKDYTPHITKMLAADPDAIAAAAINPQSTIVAKNIKAADFKGPVIFDAGAGAELFLKGAGKASEGMYMVNMPIMAANHVQATTPPVLRQKEFFKTYSSKFGQFSSFAPYAADALYLYVDAIEKAKSADPEKINDALGTIQRDGLCGRFEFSSENHGGMERGSLILLTARGGAWVPAS